MTTTPLRGSAAYLAIVPPATVRAARAAIESGRRHKTTLARIETLIRAVERTDAAAMAVTGKHAGNPAWANAALAAADAAWALRAALARL